jgi:hypothetical protein
MRAFCLAVLDYKLQTAFAICARKNDRWSTKGSRLERWTAGSLLRYRLSACMRSIRKNKIHPLTATCPRYSKAAGPEPNQVIGHGIAEAAEATAEALRISIPLMEAKLSREGSADLAFCKPILDEATFSNSSGRTTRDEFRKGPAWADLVSRYWVPKASACGTKTGANMKTAREQGDNRDGMECAYIG